jgi:hypothetical protein
LGDYYDWSNAETTDIIEKISLITKASYMYLEPENLAPTFDIKLDMSSVNIILSDFLVLTMVEMLFGIQEAYNSYAENAIGDSEIEENKIELPSEQKIVEEEQNEGDQTVEYEIVDPESEKQPVSEDKLHLWEQQINQRIDCKFEGFNVTLSERNHRTKVTQDIIFMCMQTLKVDIELNNTGMT